MKRDEWKYGFIDCISHFTDNKSDKNLFDNMYELFKFMYFAFD